MEKLNNLRLRIKGWIKRVLEVPDPFHFTLVEKLQMDIDHLILELTSLKMEADKPILSDMPIHEMFITWAKDEMAVLLHGGQEYLKDWVKEKINLSFGELQKWADLKMFDLENQFNQLVITKTESISENFYSSVSDLKQGFTKKFNIAEANLISMINSQLEKFGTDINEIENFVDQRDVDWISTLAKTKQELMDVVFSSLEEMAEKIPKPAEPEFTPDFVPDDWTISDYAVHRCSEGHLFYCLSYNLDWVINKVPSPPHIGDHGLCAKMCNDAHNSGNRKD